MEVKTELVHEEIQTEQNEERVFYKYKTITQGKDLEGKEWTFEHIMYLDSDFNEFAGRVKIGDSISDNTRLGSLLPGEVGEEDEVGLWKITPSSKKNQYRALILKQEASKLFNSTDTQTVPATWISRH